MSEENDEMVMLLKELVNKVKNLEDAVYNKDNLLMKSGYVVVDSPTPHISNDTQNTYGDSIAKMDWDDIHNIANRMG
jgi:hypothetical protein